MLFPYRFTTWLKIGFIGWLAAGSGSFNFNTSSGPGGHGGDLEKDVEQIVRSWLHEHLLIIVLLAAVIIAVSLVFVYLSCRFRFILFDSILQQDAQIGRGWARYGRPAQRFFGFQLSLMVVSVVVLALIVGLPLWRAYRRGIFSSDNPFAIFRVLVPVILAGLAFVIISAIVTSLASDFGVPLLALDDLTVGNAWSALKGMIAAEPWAFAGYLGMKLVLSIATGVMVAIAVVVVVLILFIPGLILVLVGVGIAKALGLVAGIILAVFGALAAIAIVLIISMLATAPVAVFFTSYSLYFFGGRYPKLGALLWPQPIQPPPPPLPGFSTGVPAPQTS